MTPNRPGTPDLSDPLQMAVKVTAIEGTLALMEARLTSGFGSVSSRLDAMQAEQRETTKVVGEVARQQHDLQSHSEGLDRLARSIDRHAAEFQNWRERHEEENKGVADRVTIFRGVLIGFTLLALLLSGAVVYIVQLGFQRADEKTAAARIEAMDRMDRMERKDDRIEAALEELKKTRSAR